MSNEFGSLMPLYSTLAGGLLSLMGSWGAIWFSARSKNKHAAQQLAGAFKGEMSALVHIAELRNYAGGLKSMAQWCVANNAVGFFSVPSREEYRAVYKANVGSLGSLQGDLPKQIAIVYTQMASLQEDLKTLDETHLGVRTDAWMGEPIAAAQRYSEMALLIEDTISKAKANLTDIDRLYPSPKK
ncbi:MAG: hypothetical protein CO065_08195 [Comamonadaceae bacterium CG_4_9_14_0_8_um_filter_57_21]|nr:MAG: hypothetical protein COY49_01845 [Comamonadaceae bacterium CG_4_10_14_0_8_um_filter_57_29]PJC18888.1 MAG: hypothetical protein CO065_08195 [Comamonadaceae bacterium CG_4_9_14_0_8_um_filter_57_21]